MTICAACGFPGTLHDDDQAYQRNMSVTTVRDDLINRLIRYPSAVAIRLRIARLRMLGVRIGRKCWIRRISIPRNPWDIVIADGVALDDDVVLLTTGSRGGAPKLVIGSGSYVNRFTMFDASESIEVGRNCLIGPFCYITDHDHGIEASHSRSPSSRLLAVRSGSEAMSGSAPAQLS